MRRIITMNLSLSLTILRYMKLVETMVFGLSLVFQLIKILLQWHLIEQYQQLTFMHVITLADVDNIWGLNS